MGIGEACDLGLQSLLQQLLGSLDLRLHKAGRQDVELWVRVAVCADLDPTVPDLDDLTLNPPIADCDRGLIASWVGKRRTGAAVVVRRRCVSCLLVLA
jgi:hypothetical protein